MEGNEGTDRLAFGDGSCNGPSCFARESCLKASCARVCGYAAYAGCTTYASKASVWVVRHMVTSKQDRG